jgi:outer membrane protein OmpA-like peptidoglycan-associated protein
VPVVYWQMGDDLSAVGVPNPERSAFAAPWAGLRVPVIRRSGPTGFTAALAVDGSGPYGTKDSVVAPDGWVIRPRLELGQRFGGVVLGLEAGGIYRTSPVDVGPSELTHEVVGGLVVATTGRARAEIALRGGMNLDDLGAYGEALFGLRFRISAFDAFLLGGPGFGDAPGTARFRAMFGIGWPALDMRGARPGAATTRTSTAPQPPPRPGARPQGGEAPAPAPVPLPPPPKASRAQLETGRIALSEKIEFEPGSARIAERSFGILDDVVAILESNPGVAIVVEGHTDSKGAPGKNRELSYNRAESVKKFIVRRGIEARRIDTRGYGETKPIATNSTEAGREANRRVEIRVKR